MHHELAGRPFEDALQNVSDKLTLGLLGWHACFIDVRPLGFVSANGAFCSHDLQKFQDTGVTHGPFLLQGVMHFPNRGWPSAPENAKNF
jgi:hypothetical protein